MMRSLFSGVSGLRAHQARMDVVGNNISNVNTVGYKSSRATFQEIFSETIKGAGNPEGDRGGTNPMQIGLGISLASIDTFHTRGSVERTDNPLDLAIEGNGFFVVSDGTAPKFTRAGNFFRDTEGNIVNGNGMRVLGWMADATGAMDTTVPAGAIQIPKDLQMAPMATDAMTLIGNLNANATIGDEVPFETVYYDELGRANKVCFKFEKTAADQWQLQDLADNANAVSIIASDSTQRDNIATTLAANIGFTSGVLTAPASGGFTINQNLLGPPNVDENIVVDITQITQYAAESGVDPLSVNGYPVGDLETFNFDASGIATGVFTNGQSKVLGRIALANFNNPAGLQKVGSNLYIQTPNSGDPSIGIGGDNGRGTVNPGSLEMSNVDISKEFTDMIITQRGFQANSRIITTSDEMLQELVNLKR